MYNWIIELLALSIFITVGNAGSTSSCDGSNEYIYNNCQCLKFHIVPQLSYSSAVSKCSANGGQMVTVHNEEKQSFITSILKKISTKNGVWLGMKRNARDAFIWVDGKALAGGYTPWADGEPDRTVGIIDQDCAIMHIDDSWKWKDFFCTPEKYSYICQRDIPCGDETKTLGLSTNEVIGVVIGGVAGVICFFAFIFLLINCCRDAVRQKREDRPVVELRQVETGSGYLDDLHSSRPMIPPPEKSKLAPVNDLDRLSVRKKKTSLVSANVTVADVPPLPSAPTLEPPPVIPALKRVTKQDSVKISNLGGRPANERKAGESKMRRGSDGSIEDNYLTANADTDNEKEFHSVVEGVNKL